MIDLGTDRLSRYRLCFRCFYLLLGLFFELLRSWICLVSFFRCIFVNRIKFQVWRQDLAEHH